MSDKFLIYLDQNILQYDFENQITLPELEKVQWVYSDEHFNEISRWENSGFFEVLKRIKARKLKIQLDKHFQITNEARLLYYDDPRKMYDEYRDTFDQYKQSASFFIPMQAFFYGNQEKVAPEQLSKTFRDSFNSLLDFSDIAPEIQPLLNNLNVYLDKAAEDLEKTFRDAAENIPNLSEARKKLVGRSLSNLDREDGPIVDQIWKRIAEEDIPLRKDQFFGKEPLPQTGKSEIPLFLSVVQCHSVLNYLGYFPDQGLAKISKLFGINSDASHLAHSIYCSGLMSGDNRLCKKAAAVYEYLGYPKTIYQLSSEKSESK